MLRLTYLADFGNSVNSDSKLWRKDNVDRDGRLRRESLVSRESLLRSRLRVRRRGLWKGKSILDNLLEEASRWRREGSWPREEGRVRRRFEERLIVWRVGGVGEGGRCVSWFDERLRSVRFLREVMDEGIWVIWLLERSRTFRDLIWKRVSGREVYLLWTILNRTKPCRLEI
jgi:hypothetical protein